MSESKHTPAPWTVEYGNDTGPNDGYFVEFYEVGPALIRYIDTDKEEMKANAHLIAAAPELLAALEEIQRQINQVADGDRSYTAFDTELVDATIAKAKGE